MPGIEVVIDKLLRMVQYLIAPSTSIRNRLVHEYEKTDDRIVFASLPKFLVMYRQYVAHIRHAIG